MDAVTQVIPTEADPETRLRLEWAQSLRDHMAFRQVTVKELRRRLADLGAAVSRQGIESWLAGKTSPRPHHQQAIGAALDMPARSIFPLENLPKSHSGEAVA